MRADRPRLGFRPDAPGLRVSAADAQAEEAPQVRTFGFVRRLFQEDETFRTYFLPALEAAERELQESPADPLLHAACWVATGQEQFADASVRALEEAELTATAQSSYYSEVWRFALAYDWLFSHPRMSEDGKRRIEARIADVLESELSDLDGDYSVVWHGRTQLANNSLVAALALSLDARAEQLQRRALAHYADAVRALELAEGWPEGTSYWIHNRAFPFGLAADCFITATGQTVIDGMQVTEGLRRAGLWQFYSLQPNLSFVRYGDCWDDGLIAGPGLWQPVADYYARLTRDPALVAAADHFRSHSRRRYHSGRYGWSAVLTYDPAIPMPGSYDSRCPEAYLNARLSHSQVMGRHTLGEAFLTDGWGNPDATWISFKAGDVMAHHGHYDQGSFTIYAGAPLAVHSGDYVDYFGAYRLGYFVQTVAVNSLLVQSPGEFGSFSRRAGNFDQVTGGQRVVMPTGSHMVSVNDWLRNLHAGRHYAAGEIVAFESLPDEYDYLAADLTRAYNSTLYAEPGNEAKVSAVTRKLAYLRQPRAVVILDRVVTADPSYQVQWLVHTPARPETASESQVAGQPDDGIAATSDRWLRVEHGKGQLFQQCLLPAEASILKIGGPSHRHYVETADGAINLEPSGRRREEPKDYGMWRVQVNSPGQRQEHLFLNVLWPRLRGDAKPEPAHLVSCAGGVVVVQVADWLVVFAVEGELRSPVTYQAPAGASKHLIVDLPARSTWSIAGQGESAARPASVEGVLRLEGPPEAVALTLLPGRSKGGHQ